MVIEDNGKIIEEKIKRSKWKGIYLKIFVILLILSIFRSIFEGGSSDTTENLKDNEGNVTSQGNETEYFDITESDLMLEIQKKLNKYDLDIGTKEGYPNYYFVLSDGEATDVVYQIIADDSGKVVSVFVNLINSTNDADYFSNAFTTAVFICDPKITDIQMKKMIDSVQDSNTITINNITYNGGVLTDNVLTYWFTKAK